MRPGQETLFQGSGYSDGSKLGTTLHGQVGWSVAGMEGLEPVLVAYGPLPTSLPVQRTIKRAELWGFLQLLRFAMPPIRALTDHLGIVQGLERGRLWCVAAGRPHADVWKLIWDKWEDLGKEEAGNQAIHCKAHRSKAQIQNLDRQGQEDAAGNGVADRWAKEGAGLDRGFGREQALEEEGQKVVQAAGMILERHAMVDSVWSDVCPRAEWEALKASKLARKEDIAIVEAERPARLQHDIVAYKDLAGRHAGWCCQRCRAWTRKPRAFARWKESSCKEGKWREWGIQVRKQCWMAQGHPLMRAGELIWCLRCGKYTAKTLKGLKAWCTGRPANSTRLRKLQQGRHPIDGGFLGEPQRAMGEAWWEATARHTNLARNQRDRLGITIVLGSLPDAWAEEIPFEPPEFEVEDEEGFVEEGGRPRTGAPVGSLLRNPGCLRPSDGKLPTYAAELGQMGEAELFRELSSVDPAASTVVASKPQESGPLRGQQPSGAAEGDQACPAGTPRRSARRGGGEERRLSLRPRKSSSGLSVQPGTEAQGRLVALPATGCEQQGTDPGGAQPSNTSREAGGRGGRGVCCRGKARWARSAKAACSRICGRILEEGEVCQEPCSLAEAHEGAHCFDCMHTLPPPMPARPPPMDGKEGAGSRPVLA